MIPPGVYLLLSYLQSSPFSFIQSVAQMTLLVLVLVDQCLIFVIVLHVNRFRIRDNLVGIATGFMLRGRG
jgi:hypothetical protein